MSDSDVQPALPPELTRVVRGQSMVEFALVLPILALLLVMTVDLGRVYFGWVALTNAARVGANFAANHPDWSADEQDRYVDLIEADAEARNCELAPPAAPNFSRGSTPITDPELGDYATVTLTCSFDLITPLASQVLGRESFALTAESVFPVRDGCASCPPPPPAPVPSAPAQCREIPTARMTGASVAGARLAWQSAGFSLSKFIPATGSDTATVQMVSVNENDPNSGCPAWTPGSWAIFSSTGTAILKTADPPDPSCRTVPNLIGMAVATARQKWTAAGFTGAFDPIDQDTSVVTAQATSPATSEPGISCRPPTTQVTVAVGPPWPAPPPAPCQVPNFTGVKANSAAALWTGAGFPAANIAYDGQGNFNIQQQTLVGGSWVACSSSIVVSKSS